MVRRINWQLYVVSFVIALLVFAAGVLVGNMLNSKLLEDLQQRFDSLRVQTQETELLLLLTQQVPSANESVREGVCKIYIGQLERFDTETFEFGKKLTLLQSKQGFDDPSVVGTRRDYSSLELRDFLLINEVNSICTEKLNTAIYFYSHSNCSTCNRQGEELTNLKNENPLKNMIYSFDVDYDIPSINLLKAQYSVSELPAVIINGKKLEGFTPLEELRKYVNSS